jgi:hypothetical protein
LVQALRAPGVEAYLLWLPTTGRFDPHLNKGVRITGQALDGLE